MIQTRLTKIKNLISKKKLDLRKQRIEIITNKNKRIGEDKTKRIIYLKKLKKEMKHLIIYHRMDYFKFRKNREKEVPF